MKHAIASVILHLAALTSAGQVLPVCKAPRDSLYHGQRVYDAALVKAPEYPGGLKELFKTVARHTYYSICRDCWEGTVYLDLLIDTTGKVALACIRYPGRYEGSPPFEFRSLLEDLQPFTPGELENKKVPCRLLVPARIRQQ